eukprot:SAG31_NODE_3163_length_4605_cov_15.046383_9_plen_87_part_00
MKMQFRAVSKLQSPKKEGRKEGKEGKKRREEKRREEKRREEKRREEKRREEKAFLLFPGEFVILFLYTIYYIHKIYCLSIETNGTG